VTHTDTPDTSADRYERLRQEGELELARPVVALWWSGVAAGLCMSTSVTASAFLRQQLPDAPWSNLVVDLGYCVGFLIVILGQLQLFTENTITTVLPVLTSPSWGRLASTARLWTVVTLANLVGAAIAAIGCMHLATPAQAEALLTIAHHATGTDAMRTFGLGIPAGFLIATLVWLLQGARSGRVALIVILTYLIALGDFAHVIAGSVEAFVVFAHDGDVLNVLAFILPAFLGNVVGGTGMFTLLTYAQVRTELPGGSADPAAARNEESRLA
jgi:formate/nitrite transporter FocA (FNT family)